MDPSCHNKKGVPQARLLVKGTPFCMLFLHGNPHQVHEYSMWTYPADLGNHMR